MKFDKAIPVLHTRDIPEILAYFIEQLKFENKWEWGAPPTFAGVQRDNVEIFFSLDDKEQPPGLFYLVVDNVDEYYEQVKNSGAKILSEPGTKTWNMREMIVECPGGHTIFFGHNTACD